MRRWPVIVIMAAYLGCGLWGVDWGLYGDVRDRHLFPDGSDWSPERVARFYEENPPGGAAVGADVDPNPADPAGPLVLNDEPAAIAELYARYLLYSNQPDEMITWRALSRIDPGAWQFDPQLYQYGGLFVYPLGVLVKLGAVVGQLHLGGLPDMLRAPHEFARLYVVGRLYVLAWGLLGVWVVYALAARLGDHRAGLLAAACTALMPVVVALSHESKPHLPGAVLMLCAVLWALRYVETGLVKYRLGLAVSCGLATGMVVSSLWIFLLIPLAEFLTKSGTIDRLSRSAVFGLIGAGVYGLTNPYVLINIFRDRTLLLSNVQNSLAMYHAGDLLPQMPQALSLFVQGSSAVVVVGGAAMLVALSGRDWRRILLLLLPAAAVALQFALLAGGKPGEYTRFSVFPNVVLAVALAAGVFRFLVQRGFQAVVFAAVLLGSLALPSRHYLRNLQVEKTARNSRYQLASALQAETSAEGGADAVATLRQPAPYGFPPLDFSRQRVVLLPPEIAAWPAKRPGWPARLIVPLNGVEGVDLRQILSDGYYQLDPAYEQIPADLAPATWANKPLLLLLHRKPPPPE